MTLIETGPPGIPTWPDDPGRLLYDCLLRTARTTGRCPVWIHPTALEHPIETPAGPAAPTAAIDASRPADVRAALGWPGIANYVPRQDLTSISAVLRRWEDRWGAQDPQNGDHYTPAIDSRMIRGVCTWSFWWDRP